MKRAVFPFPLSFRPCKAPRAPSQAPACKVPLTTRPKSTCQERLAASHPLAASVVPDRPSSARPLAHSSGENSASTIASLGARLSYILPHLGTPAIDNISPSCWTGADILNTLHGILLQRQTLRSAAPSQLRQQPFYTVNELATKQCLSSLIHSFIHPPF